MNVKQSHQSQSPCTDAVSPNDRGRGGPSGEEGSTGQQSIGLWRTWLVNGKCAKLTNVVTSRLKRHSNQHMVIICNPGTLAEVADML